MMSDTSRMTRRVFCQSLAFGGASLTAGIAPADDSAVARDQFTLTYIVASPMYGTAALSTIVPQVPRCGTRYLDIWPRPHGNQREQLEEMGREKFADLLAEHGVRLGAITRYDLFPFKLGDEMRLCARLGGSVMVGGSRGPKGLTGSDLREAMRKFAERMKPHAEAAAKLNLTLAVENHRASLLESPDSLRWFREFVTMDNVGVAFAPHHLPQDALMQAKLIEELGPKVAFFYAQQHGNGSHHKMPKEQELLQMPGRGPLDFGPLVASLRRIDFRGFTEIYMHPYPRGLPILDTPDAITAEINRSRTYLAQCLRKS